MKVLFDMSGWTKVYNIDEYLVRSGSINLDINLYPPDRVPCEGQQTGWTRVIMVKFTATGERSKSGLPIFRNV